MTDGSQEETKESSESEVEINSGVEFDGNCLESMLEFRVDDIEVSSWDIIVAELMDTQTRSFVFKYVEIKILGYG